MSKYKTKETMFIHSLNSLYARYHWIDVISFQLFKNDKMINCLHIKNKSSIDSSSIMIYAQDEQSNLGKSLSFLMDLSSYFKISIITYEYSNISNTDQVKSNIDYLYTYLTKLITIKRIILFGFSIGVYAVVSLIQTRELKKVSSIILLSPNWSFSPDFLRKNKKATHQLKKRQITSLSSINKPIMVIHGKKDDYIKYMLSYQICHRISNLIEWYPENGKHWDIQFVYRSKLYKKIDKFFKTNSGVNKSMSIVVPNSNIEIFTPNLCVKTPTHSFNQTDYDEGFKGGNVINIGAKSTNNNYTNTNSLSIGVNQQGNANNKEIEYYQTFREGDIIPLCSSYKKAEMNNEIMISSYKKYNDYNNSYKDQDGFSFTQKTFHHNASFNISN